MMKRIAVFFFVLMFGVLMSGFKTPNNTRSIIGKGIPEFALKNVDGKQVALSQYPKAKGFAIVFICNHCPFAKLYSERLNTLNTEYTPLGVPLLVINSMDTLVYEDESFSAMQQRAATDHFNFPYLQDAGQTVARSFGAEHTPQAFVLWKEEGKWIVKYSGAFDNNGKEPQKATPYLANALDELLQGKSVQLTETQSFGCAIYYREVGIK